MNFKQFLMLQESKAIIFPPEIQEKLHEITDKVIAALGELDKEEVDPKGEKFKLVDWIVFNDPYTKKQTKYAVYAAKFGNEHENSKSGGYQDAFNTQPNLVLTTNIARDFPYVFHVLSHELAHAYDPTLTKGYRFETGAPEEYMKKLSAKEKYLQDLKDKRPISNPILRGAGQIFGSLGNTAKKLFGYKEKPTPVDDFEKHMKDSQKTKVTPFFYPSENDGTEEGKKKAFDKYYEQEPEFIANVSAYANSIISSARSIKNSSPDLIFLSKYIVQKQFIDFVKKGFPEEYKDLLPKDTHITHPNSIRFQSYLTRYKDKNPKFYRKFLEKISNAALEAYKIVDQYIKTNNLESKVSPEVKKFIRDNSNKEIIPAPNGVKGILNDLVGNP
jgi:hypothetical protein